jgi:hypothetical protein
MKRDSHGRFTEKGIEGLTGHFDKDDFIIVVGDKVNELIYKVNSLEEKIGALDNNLRGLVNSHRDLQEETGELKKSLNDTIAFCYHVNHEVFGSWPSTADVEKERIVFEPGCKFINPMEEPNKLVIYTHEIKFQNQKIFSFNAN